MPSGQPLRVLFLARRYLPSRGGAQTHAYKLFTYLDARMPVTLVALRQALIVHLLWYMPWAWLRVIVTLLLRRADIVYFSDGVAASLACVLSPFKGRTRCSLYGLEMTFENRLARKLMGAGVRRCDGIAVISNNSIRIAEEVWDIPRDRMRLIYLGAEPEELAPELDEALRKAFEGEHGVDFDRDRIVLNLGRQVPRKGMAAFIEYGVPLLDPEITLLVVGGGQDAGLIAAKRMQLDCPERARILGILDEKICSMLRRHCDLFLMPNMETIGDVEGYGIAPLEAMFFGTPVVAFAVDALVEAVREGGWLIPPGDYQAFADTVHDFYKLSQEERTEAGRRARAHRPQPALLVR